MKKNQNYTAKIFGIDLKKMSGSTQLLYLVIVISILVVFFYILFNKVAGKKNNLSPKQMKKI